MGAHDIKTSNIGRLIALFLVPLVLWRFYWYVGFNYSVITLSSFILSAILVIYMMIITLRGKLEKINRESSYSKCIFAFFLITLFSMFNAYVYRDQNFILTFRAGCFAFIVIYFFILYSVKASYKEVLLLVFLFSIVYLFLWLYAISKAPLVVFGNLEEVTDSRGFSRIINLNSRELIYILFFFSIVKLAQKNTAKKALWIAILIVSFWLIVVTLSRMVIMAALLVSVFYLFRKKPFYLIIVTIIVISFSSFILNNPIVSSLLNLSQDEIEVGSESALRMAEYLHFNEYYPFKIGTFLFGNGSPHVESSYGAYEEMLKASFRFNRSDAGPVGLYVTYGISAIIVFLIILIKVLKQKVSKDAMPFKLFIVFLYIINITSWEFFSCGIGFMLSLYILDCDKNNMLNV